MKHTVIVEQKDNEILIQVSKYTEFQISYNEWHPFSFNFVCVCMCVRDKFVSFPF